MVYDNRLDPQVKQLLTAIYAAGNPQVEDISVEEARRMVDTGVAQMKFPVTKVHSIEDKTINGRTGEISIRIYRPSDKPCLPVLLFIHGGGWVLFSPATYDPLCTAICSEADCMIVSVGYRLSPESKFPVAPDDCMDALQWVLSNASGIGGDPTNVIVCGDSAGGNLAAVTAIRARDEGFPKLAGQVLIYPVTAYCDPGFPSIAKYSDGYNLSKEVLRYFWDLYLDDPKDRNHPWATPLNEKNLRDLPPALIILSAFDPLVDEGLAYSKRLSESGCKVTQSLYPDMIHGFLSYLGYIDRARDGVREISLWLRERFGI